MERSQSQPGLWPTTNEIDHGIVDDSSQSNILTKENRRLLMQYFTSKTRSSLGRTSSSGHTRLTDQETQQITSCEVCVCVS